MCVCVCVQGVISNILEENVVQPLLVSTSAVQLAAETVRSILKIDDLVCVCVCVNTCVYESGRYQFL